MRKPEAIDVLAWAFCATAMACGGADTEGLIPPPEPPSAPTAQAEEAQTAWPRDGYRKAIDDALEALLSAEPVRASVLGDHRFDAQWPDISEAGEQRVADAYGQHAASL